MRNCKSVLGILTSAGCGMARGSGVQKEGSPRTSEFIPIIYFSINQAEPERPISEMSRLQLRELRRPAQGGQNRTELSSATSRSWRLCQLAGQQ